MPGHQRQPAAHQRPRHQRPGRHRGHRPGAQRAKYQRPERGWRSTWWRPWVSTGVGLRARAVRSAWGAVPMLPSRRFRRPLAEPAVCVSTGNGLSTVSSVRWGAPPSRDWGLCCPCSGKRLMRTEARLYSRSRPPWGPVWCRRTSRHLQRCSFRNQRITLCHTKFSREPMVCLTALCPVGTTRRTDDRSACPLGASGRYLPAA